MMFEIRYSGVDEIELSASRNELEQLRTALFNLMKDDLREIRFETDNTIDPAPWESAGQALYIGRFGNAVKVSISVDSTLVIEGSDQNLDNFASFLSFDETTESGEHSHFEFHEGNDYITPDSIPLIISVK